MCRMRGAIKKAQDVGVIKPVTQKGTTVTTKNTSAPVAKAKKVSDTNIKMKRSSGGTKGLSTRSTLRIPTSNLTYG